MKSRKQTTRTTRQSPGKTVPRVSTAERRRAVSLTPEARNEISALLAHVEAITQFDIRNFRHCHGISQDRLARGACVPLRTILRWERKEDMPRISSLAAFCQELLKG